jgi:hypothetical protein
VVTAYKDEQYMRLGMFVVACCVMNWPVGFEMVENPTALGVKWGQDEERGGEVGKFVRWVRETWVKKNPEWVERIYEATPAEGRNVSSHRMSGLAGESASYGDRQLPGIKER